MKAHWLVGAVVAAVFVILFRGPAFGGRLPLDVVDTDDVSFVGTVYEQAAARWAQGRLPLWFPEFDCGTPLAAAWMYGLWYPGLALFAMAPLGVAWAWTAALHAGFGAAGMSLFLRRRGCDAASAAAGAVLFAVSEHFVGRTSCGHLNLVLPLAWAPWVLHFVAAAVAGERRAVPLLALTSAAGLLAGHVQTWMYLGPLAAAFGVAEAWGRDAGRELRGATRTSTLSSGEAGPSAGHRSRAAALRRVVAGAALGLGIVAAQIAATAEFVGAAAPPAAPDDVVRAVSVPPAVLAQKAFAAFLGPAPESGAPDFRHEHRGVAGLWVLALAAWGVARGGGTRRWFWAAAAVVGLLAAIGTRSAATAWLQHVPPFSLSRAPGRALVLPLVALPVLAAYGLAALPLAEMPRRAVAAAVALLAVLFGVPAVRDRSDELHRMPGIAGHLAPLGTHRLRSPPLYQTGNVERHGFATLRTPCFVNERGYTALMTDPTAAIAYWVDCAADLDPHYDHDADGVPVAITGFDVQRFDAMGRTRFFPSAVHGVADADALARLRGGERSLFVDGAPAEGSSGVGAVRDVFFDDREIRVDVDTTGPGWLLVSSKLLPGWTATVGGAPGELRRGNLAFPAVRLPAAGRHAVVLRYAPWSLRIGGAISLAALAAALLLLVRAGRVPSPR